MVPGQTSDTIETITKSKVYAIIAAVFFLIGGVFFLLAGVTQ